MGLSGWWISVSGVSYRRTEAISGSPGDLGGSLEPLAHSFCPPILVQRFPSIVMELYVPTPCHRWSPVFITLFKSLIVVDGFENHRCHPESSESHWVGHITGAARLAVALIVSGIWVAPGMD